MDSDAVIEELQIITEDTELDLSEDEDPSKEELGLLTPYCNMPHRNTHDATSMLRAATLAKTESLSDKEVGLYETLDASKLLDKQNVCDATPRGSNPKLQTPTAAAADYQLQKTADVFVSLEDGEDYLEDHVSLVDLNDMENDSPV
jgi:hypothetical protein